MHNVKTIAPSKFTNYPVLFSQQDLATFDQRCGCPVCEAKPNHTKTALEIGAADWDEVIKVQQCQKCGHIYYHNSPSEAWMLDYYSKDWMKQSDAEKLTEPKPIKPAYKMVDLLKDIQLMSYKNPAIFDVGCGPAILLKGLKESGYDNLFGCEQSPNRHQIASHEFGDNIYNGGYQDVEKDQKYDLIYSNHVLEHIYDPRHFMKWCENHLSDNGSIAIFVPNAEYESVFGQAFFLPHLHSFTYQSLKALGEAFGFSVKFWTGCRHDEIGVIYTKKRKLDANLFLPAEEMTNHSIDDLFDRLQGPWKEKSQDFHHPVTLTYHIPNMIPSEKTVWRSYVRLDGLSVIYIKAIRSVSSLAYKLKLSFFVRHLPLLLKLISKPDYDVKNVGYITFYNSNQNSQSIPRVFHKDQAFLLFK